MIKKMKCVSHLVTHITCKCGYTFILQHEGGMMRRGCTRWRERGEEGEEEEKGEERQGAHGGEKEEEKMKKEEEKQEKQENSSAVFQSGYPLCQSSPRAPERDRVNERGG